VEEEILEVQEVIVEVKFFGIKIFLSSNVEKFREEERRFNIF